MGNRFLVGSLAALIASAALAQAQGLQVQLPPSSPPSLEVPTRGGPAGPLDSPYAGSNNPELDAGRMWFSGDYLLWWTKASPVPPLVITGPTAVPVGPFIIGPVKLHTSPGFIGLQTITNIPTTESSKSKDPVYSCKGTLA